MTDTAPRRARTMAELGVKMGAFIRPDEVGAAFAAYRPRATDVIIAPFAKCGTTWLQQSLHALRTGGDMDFDDISAVVPWIETAVALDIDLEAPQRAEPRAFKSHLAYTMVPKGARYVVALREPRDALVSYYKFMEGWLFEPGAISITEFAEMRFADAAGPRSYWTHLLSWWEQRDNPDVLLTTYELMTQTPREHMVRLARFSGLAPDAARLELALEHSSLDFMKRHGPAFADPMMQRLSQSRCDLPPGGDSAKVRKGGVGGHVDELPAEIGERLDAVWAELVAPVTGLADYQALHDEIARRWQVAEA